MDDGCTGCGGGDQAVTNAAPMQMTKPPNECSGASSFGTTALTNPQSLPVPQGFTCFRIEEMQALAIEYQVDLTARRR